MNRQEIKLLIHQELTHQEEIGYNPDHDAEHTSLDWCLIAQNYLGKASAAAVQGRPIRHRFIQLAAIIFAALEALPEGS